MAVPDQAAVPGEDEGHAAAEHECCAADGQSRDQPGTVLEVADGSIGRRNGSFLALELGASVVVTEPHLGLFDVAVQHERHDAGRTEERCASASGAEADG